MKELKLRLYQEKILATCAEHNTLVVLPTGLGKTFIALALAKHRLKERSDQRIVFLAPTKPLVNQHYQVFDEYLIEEMACLTGSVTPSKRKKMWEQNAILFATPQTIENDLLSGKISFKKVSLMVFDEAHRAVGDYAYTFLADQYLRQAKNPRVLALTASPGSSEEKIQGICRTLGVQRIELRTADDPDVQEYVQDKAVHYVKVELPEEYEAIREAINKVLKQRLSRLKEMGAIKKNGVGAYSKKRFLILQKYAMKKASHHPQQETFQKIFLLSSVIKLRHAKEVLETQGVESFKKYYKNLRNQKSKSAQSIVEHPAFQKALKSVEEVSEHPKYDRLVKILEKERRMVGDFKAIIFTNYRHTASRVAEYLTNSGFKPAEFVGQSKGLTQKKQIKMLEDFKAGDYDSLVATSIGEEGLHIENADVGVFFEPVPSALRTIQRKGRIGRTNFGVIYVMMTDGAVDEKYHWIAHNKEKKMRRVLRDMKQELINKEQKSLNEFKSG